MGRPQRYRGVRQRHWGSWVSEIRHPLLKTRVWLGTFETAEDAAHAYDEAARLMCGIRARTNFPLDPNAPQSPKFQKLSATLSAKLHRWYLASQQDAQDQNHAQQHQQQQEESCMSEEDKFASEMIEELLGYNNSGQLQLPSPSVSDSSCCSSTSCFTAFS
ncbi:unnamed protein product [Sphagnum jensenii]|uniref:AP2/ERF domain-containing protein n=1 Tax=Sphagnum jensenii TaxID=128206 RepID=A0ABP0X0V5_9BRYO